MAQNVLVQSKVKPELKAKAENVFNALGMSIGDAIRIFLQQSVNVGGLPFQPTAKPNLEDELKRLQRIIKADQTFAEMRKGQYTEG